MRIIMEAAGGVLFMHVQEVHQMVGHTLARGHWQLQDKEVRGWEQLMICFTLLSSESPVWKLFSEKVGCARMWEVERHHHFRAVNKAFLNSRVHSFCEIKYVGCRASQPAYLLESAQKGNDTSPGSITS